MFSRKHLCRAANAHETSVEADYVIRTQLFRCEKNHQKKENCLVENAHVILHSQHCLEEKTQNFTRARQSSTRQVDVLCEARRCSSSYKCSAGNTYAELQARTKQVWEADYVIRTQLFRCEKSHQKKKLFSGKCSRYFTPSALPRREDPNSRARVSLQRDKWTYCVKLEDVQVATNVQQEHLCRAANAHETSVGS